MAIIEKQLRNYVWRCCAAATLVLLAACGGGKSSTTTNQTMLSGITKRVLLSNFQSGSVTILDAQKDRLSTFGVSVSGPTKMVTASGNTVLMQTGFSSVEVYNSATETVPVQLTIRDQPFDVAISTDGKTGYAAMRNVGEIAVFNTSNGGLFSITGLPTVSRLVEGLNQHKMLAFSDGANGLVTAGQATFFLIDTGTNTFKPISAPFSVLDQPYSAVFDPSDGTDNTAFILNCGPECGGIAASVVKVTNLSGVPSFSAPVPVSAATVGFLSGSNLFVAGSPSAGPTGTVQSINTGSMTASAPITIANGHHRVITMASNNRLYIGATGCTATVDPSNSALTKACLSILNTGSGAVTVPEVSSFRQNFDATGFQPISGRTVVYVCLGGELDIFDTNTDLAIIPSPPIDIVGRAFDVVQIDP